MRKQIAAILTISAVILFSSQAEETKASTWLAKIKNLVKSTTQTTQERQDQIAKEQELKAKAQKEQEAKLIETSRIQALSKTCGKTCRPHEVCCVIPGTESGPVTYCAEKCAKNNQQIV